MPGKRWPPVPPPQTIARVIRLVSCSKTNQSELQILTRLFAEHGLIFSVLALQLLHGLFETFRAVAVRKTFVLVNKLIKPTIQVFGLMADTADRPD
jgi:hypothetical protein